MASTLRLRPELVPRRLWGISAQELLGSAWRRRIRPQALSVAKNGRCIRCGDPDGRIVHEEWEYDDEEGVATLVGLAPICKDCHAVAHIDQLPTVDQARAVQHLAEVNRIGLPAEGVRLVDPLLLGLELSSRVLERASASGPTLELDSLGRDLVPRNGRLLAQLGSSFARRQ